MKTMKDILQKKAYIQSLKNGSTRVAAAEAADTCTTTIWNWRQDDEEFAKAEQAALESRVEIVVDSLYQNAKGYEKKDKKGKKQYVRGNVIAQIFYLKNRGKGKWKEKHEIDIKEIRTIKVKSFIQAGEAPVIKEEEPVGIEEEESNLDKKKEPVEEIETVL